MGKGGVRGKLQNFFLGVTYSRVFKKQNCSYKLAIAAFLKSTAIGPPKKTDVRGKLQNFFFGVTYSRVFKKQKCSYRLAMTAFLKNIAISRLFQNLRLDLWPRFSKTRL